jgi:hypothetical protein
MASRCFLRRDKLYSFSLYNNSLPHVADVMEEKGISLWTCPPSKACSYLTSAIVADPTHGNKTANPKPFGMFMPGDVSASTLTYPSKLNKERIFSRTTMAGFHSGAVEKAAVAPATCSFSNLAFFALMISKCLMLSSALCTALSFFLSCALFAVGGCRVVAGCWVVWVGVGLLLVGLELVGLEL